MYRAWLRGEFPGYDYVARYGFGHEWWNFYERFSNEYYYGYAPPVHALRPRRFRNGGAIFFISRRIRGGWFLVGVYGYAEILDKPVDVGVLWDYVPVRYRGEILESTRKKLTGEDLEPLETPSYFVLRARKDYSTPMPSPMPISLPDDIGVKMLGTAMYKYIDLNRALALLDKAIEYVDSFLDVTERVRGSLWADPLEASRRLKRLREHLVKLSQTPVTVIQGPRPTTPPMHARRETLWGHYPSHMPMGVPEKLIEDALAENLEVIEEGLRFASRQVEVPGVGRIDILAYDKNGTPVVIEVKSGKADDATLTQLLAYMSGIEEKEGRKPRGVIVAEDFTRKLRHAIKTLNNIKLVRITAKVTIEKVEEIQ